ncbi:hypothetical protein [Cellvibrio sp. BR]|uniref:hypothetical protein n=1 Tax=Cellvibrio sp. BR TaxID=1134474 RepID=UPI0003057672|nr:hypothetical protein [Cellvibrio sp. BR]
MMKKILGLFLYVTLALASTGCFSQQQGGQKEPVTLQKADVTVIRQFSDVLANKEREKFVELFAPAELRIYRGFASGNLGARGDSLIETFTARDIKQDLTIDIDGQTPLDFPWLFPGLIEQKGTGLVIYPLATGAIDLQNPPATLSRLQEALAGKTELVDGVPLLLVTDKNAQVLVEAQIIDGILVGGFAIFDESRLLAIWDVR